MSICIIAPSYIDSDERMKFATDSFDSLKNAQQNYQFPIFVNDESPFDWKSDVQSLYSGENIEILHGIDQTGSAAALLRVAEYALSNGYKFGYIHLDDHVYIELFEKLLKVSEQFMIDRKDVKWLRYSGYPLIGNSQKPSWQITDHKLNFCNVEFTKTLYNENNFWTSPVLQSLQLGDSSYWTIALWHCLFDLEFLCDLLKVGMRSTFVKTS